MNQNIQSKVRTIMKSIYSYDININDFNKYYNCFDIIKVTQQNNFIIENKFFHTTRNIDASDLKNLKISYQYVKKTKGFYSRYTGQQVLNILHKIAILDEEAPDYDFYNHIKSIVKNNSNSIFFFGIYESSPIISKEKDIYNTDLGSLFINIDNKYKYKKKLKNKKMLKINEI